MKRIFVAICLFFSIFCAYADAHTYKLSICAIFQDEAKYMKEWIEFHRMLGVEHFYLYNNNSTDNYLEVLKPYIKKNRVTLIDWPSDPSKDWTPHQVDAYNHCIETYKNKTCWLAIIDLDEFIVPVKHDSLTALLKNYEGAGGLQIFWQFFGTSWIKSIPSDKTLVESLVLKAPKDYGGNYNFKTIVQPKTVKKYYVHGGEYHHPWHELFPHGTRGGAMQPIHVDIVRIHHYWTRDEDYFINQKVKRRERYENSPYTPERIQQIYLELNQELDETILRFVPKLRQRLGFVNGYDF